MGFWDTKDRKNPSDWDMEEQARYLIAGGYVIDTNIDVLIEKMKEQKRKEKFGDNYMNRGITN